MILFTKIFVAALVGFLAVISPALAQQKAPPPQGAEQVVQLRLPIAMIAVQEILRDAAAVKNIREQVTEYGAKFEKEIENERNKIRTANQELARQRTILTPESFAEKRREFEQKVVEVQRLVQQRQRELNKSRDDALAVVNKAYTEIVEKLAKERNYLVILRKAQMVYAVPDLDITNQVLTRLDKNLPSVKVAEPGK